MSYHGNNPMVGHAVLNADNQSNVLYEVERWEAVSALRAELAALRAEVMQLRRELNRLKEGSNA